MDVLQTVQYAEPAPERLPLPSFRDKTLSNSTAASYDAKSATLELVAPDLALAIQIIQEIIQNSNKFLPGDSFQDLAASINITLTPDNPITYDVTYLYPRTIDEYAAEPVRDYGIVTAPLFLTQHNIFQYNLTLQISESRFGIKGGLVGIKMSPATFNIRASCFEEKDTPNSMINLIYPIPYNPNTLQFRENKAETVEGNPIYDYTWTGTLA